MYDPELAEESKREKELNGDTADEAEGESLELVVLDELVQVDAEHLKRDAHVVAEVEVIVHRHDRG